MDRIFAWIVGRVRWLFLAATVGGAVFAYLGWRDATHIREVSANGVEATANVTGATHTTRRRGGDSYSLDLAWQDAEGNARTAADVHITGSFARQAIVGNRVGIDSVHIKYLPDPGVDSAPIVLDDDPARQEESAEFMLMLGIGLFGGGAVGSLIMLLLPRRRRALAAPQTR